MAEDKSTQTQYANPDTGEVPIASKPDIIRENPYGSDVPVPGTSAPTQSNVLSVPETTITGRPLDPTIAQNLSDTPPATTPLSQQAYNQYQIQSGEQRKETIAQEGSNLARGQEDLARINHEAWLANTQSLYGNPEKLHQAQQALTVAQALPANDPNRQSAIINAQAEVNQNMGSVPLLHQSKARVDFRDDELRAEIRKARNMKIDPDRWWNEKSTEGKILAGIGMVLGGIGGGLAKTGRNPAMEVMNNAIERDINSQKNDIDNAWKAIDKQHALNNDAFTRDLHFQTYLNYARTAGWETAKSQLAEAAAKTQSETVRNNAANMIQDITDQQMKIRNDQWRLAVAAQQADIERMRKLAVRYSDNVKAYAEKEGVDFETASRAVGSLPEFRPLVSNPGYAPPYVAGDQALRSQLSDWARRYKSTDPKMTDEQALAMAQRYATQQIRDQILKANPGMDPAQAMEVANTQVSKRINLATGGGIGTVVPPKKEGAESAEQILGRTVLIDGKPVQTVNKKAADDWKEYNDAAQEGRRLLQVMKQTQPSTLYGPGGGSGDPAAYEAARAKMIEILPKIYGFNRGPTQAQVKLTFGPEAIPEYVHWYSPAVRGRAETKLGELENTLNQIDTSMRASTFPTQTGQTKSPNATPPAPTAPSPKNAADLNNQYGAKPTGK